LARSESASQAQLGKLAAQIQDLKSELQTRPDESQVQKLTNELRVLKQLEFNVIDDDDANGKAAVGGAEKLLLQRVRRSEAEGTTLNMRMKELETALHISKEGQGQLEELNANQMELINQLEEDLQAVGKSGREESQSSPQQGGLSLSHVLTGSTDDQSKPAGNRHTDDDAMLGIVTAQRDRFKQRIRELEAEKLKLAGTVGRHRSKAENLEKDNLALYEKMRYLEAYKDRAPVAAKTRDIESGDVESKYGRIYEENMNPFTVFHRKQQQLNYNKLTAAEKITLSGSRLFTSSKFARTFVLFYAVCLHVLVFLALSYSAHMHAHPHEHFKPFIRH